MTVLFIIGIIVQYIGMCQAGRKILAKKIKLYRIRAGLTKEQLSLKLNFDNSYISKVENKKLNISIDRIEQLANFFQIEIYKLFK